MGPSASGKTYSVENRLLNEEQFRNEGIKSLIAIDGGDMREASVVYQKAISKFQLETFSKVFKKSLVEKNLYKDIKNYIRDKKIPDSSGSPEIASPNNLSKTKKKEIKQQFRKEVAQPKYRSRVLCIGTKVKDGKDENLCNEDNWQEQIQTTGIPTIAYVCTPKKFKRLDTTDDSGKKAAEKAAEEDVEEDVEEEEEEEAEEEVPRKEEEEEAANVFPVFYKRKAIERVSKLNHIKKGIEKKIFGGDKNFQIQDTTFMLVLCPKNITTKQGENREEKEGKKFSNYYYGASINGAIDIIKHILRKKSKAPKEEKGKYKFFLDLNLGIYGINILKIIEKIDTDPNDPIILREINKTLIETLGFKNFVLLIIIKSIMEINTRINQFNSKSNNDYIDETTLGEIIKILDKIIELLNLLNPLFTDNILEMIQDKNINGVSTDDKSPFGKSTALESTPVESPLGKSTTDVGTAGVSFAGGGEVEPGLRLYLQDNYKKLKKYWENRVQNEFIVNFYHLRNIIMPWLEVFEDTNIKIVSFYNNSCNYNNLQKLKNSQNIFSQTLSNNLSINNDQISLEKATSIDFSANKLVNVIIKTKYYDSNYIFLIQNDKNLTSLKSRGILDYFKQKDNEIYYKKHKLKKFMYFKRKFIYIISGGKKYIKKIENNENNEYNRNDLEQDTNVTNLEEALFKFSESLEPDEIHNLLIITDIEEESQGLQPIPFSHLLYGGSKKIKKTKKKYNNKKSVKNTKYIINNTLSKKNNKLSKKIKTLSKKNKKLGKKNIGKKSKSKSKKLFNNYK